MRRNKAFKRGRALSILLAGMTGYLIGGWHPAAMRTADPSAAELIALRFPQEWNAASPAADMTALAATKAPASAPNDLQLALFSPEPMVPQAGVPQAGPQVAAPAPQQAIAEPVVQTAAAEDVGSSPAPEASEPPRVSPAPRRRPGRRARLRRPRSPSGAVSRTGRATCSTTRRSQASRSGCI